MFNKLILIIICIAVAALIILARRHFSFWHVRGIPYIIDSLDMFFMLVGPSHYAKQIYDEYKHLPYLGTFLLNAPKLMVNDPELIKKILVQDADCFPGRKLIVDDKLDPLFGKSIIVISGDKWKQIRSVMSSSFTPGKMKSMFQLVDKCAQEMVHYMHAFSAQGNQCPLKDTMTRYTSQILASCVIGIETDNFADNASDLMTNLQRCADITTYKSLVLLLMSTMPRIQQLLRLQIIESEITEFSREFFWDNVNQREQKQIIRNDLLQSLMELRRKKKNGENSDFRLDGDDFIAQLGALFIAGYDTSTAALTFGLYELACNTQIQTKLREEIQQVLATHDHKVTYEAVQEMKYLDMVTSEILRKYPILGFLDRACIRDYELPELTVGKGAPTLPADTAIVISVLEILRKYPILGFLDRACIRDYELPELTVGKGAPTLPADTAIVISVLGIHYDPQYYPEPEAFDPERFTEENKQTRPSFTYLPFGGGPRICIGIRFAFLLMKTALAHILTNFKVITCKDTPQVIKYDPRSFVLRPASELPVHLLKL